MGIPNFKNDVFIPLLIGFVTFKIMLVTHNKWAKVTFLFSSEFEVLLIMNYNDLEKSAYLLSC